MAKATARAFSAARKALVQVGAHRMDSWSQPATESGEYSDADREHQDHAVQFNDGFTRKHCRDHGRDHLDATVCKEASEDATRHRQNEALHEKLADKPPSARAERRPDGNLFFADCGACEQQVRHIAACDQK